MDWMPAINERSTKGCDLAIGAIVAVGMAAMFILGVPWASPFLLSVPAACVIALGLRYWHKWHKVDVITLGALAAKGAGSKIRVHSR